MRVSQINAELSQFQNVQIMWHPETEIELGCWVAFVYCHAQPDPHIRHVNAGHYWLPIRLFADYQAALSFAGYFNATHDWEAMESWTAEYA